MRGMVECWHQVMGNWSPEDDFPSKTHHNMAEHWTAILSSFTSHHPGRLALCMFFKISYSSQLM